MINDGSANLPIELERELSEIDDKLRVLRDPLHIAEKETRLAELNAIMQDSEFWTREQETAGQLQQERTKLEREIARFNSALRAYTDCKELLQMAEADRSVLDDIQTEVEALKSEVRLMEMESLLSKPHDHNNAIVNINVGQGGIDSQDFAQMLMRMYRRYAERQKFAVELMDVQYGEGAGIKSATLMVSGQYAYGFLKAEIGVHRLVRISPFDTNARRHTSFASVWVLPEIDDDFEIEIKAEDLRIDTYRAGGAGGQHVNKTDSAIRITHIPTNIAVACQAERSQQKNRSTAMKLLKARLYELERKKLLAEKDKAEAEKMEASFGSQIRNYVLAPYRIVKDLRSGHEAGNVDAVLDGDIQPFIEAYLLHERIENR